MQTLWDELMYDGFGYLFGFLGLCFAVVGIGLLCELYHKYWPFGKEERHAKRKAAEEAASRRRWADRYFWMAEKSLERAVNSTTPQERSRHGDDYHRYSRRWQDLRD